MSQQRELGLRLQRTYAASRERVFRAWTEPEALVRWFRPLGYPIAVAQLELWVGGHYQFVIQAPDDPHLKISGRYVEIVRPEKLVFTWLSEMTERTETLVTMTFAERGNLTDLLLIHERFVRPEFVQPHEEGWTTMLSALQTIFVN